MDNTISAQEFIVTARKWRPLKFKDVVGQEHITTTLKNAIMQNRVHHAYLFSGPRGVGKTTTARIFARALNCLNPIDAEPCNECDTCTAVISGRSIDVIEIDGASNNSVDDIRKLRENAKYPPAVGKYKMYIIDEVHMLSTSAFNALLKTLEEPPPHLIFVFATTEPHKVPATILSRCQRFEFRRMEIEDIVGQLKYIAEREGIEIDEEALVSIAKKADGSMRDSQSIFDQVVAFCGKEISYKDMADALHLIDREFFFRISNAIKEKNMEEMFIITNQVVNKGYDLQECMNGLLEHFRNILAYKVTKNDKLLESSASYREKYKQESEFFNKHDLLRIMNLISTTEQALKYSPQPRIRFELALSQMAAMDSTMEISELLEEIKKLKKVPAGNGTSAPLPANTAGAMLSRDLQASYNPAPQPKVKMEPFPKAAPFTSQVLETKMPAMMHASAEKAAINSPGVVQMDLSSEALQSGWRDFLNRYATGESGFHMLNQSAIVMPKFYNGEIIIHASSQFAADNINKRKKTLLQNLSDFFGGRIDVKIMVGTIEETAPVTRENVLISNSKKVETISTQNSINNIPTQESAGDEKISNASMEDKHPVERAIVDLFGAREYLTPGTA